MRAIGSVIATPHGTAPVAQSALAHLTQGREWAGFRTARGALAALLRHRGRRRVWLPAYLCDVLAEAARGCEMAWYGVDQGLNIDIASLLLESGDAVVVIDYFGRSPSPELYELAHGRPDVLWIEDRAQALAPDGPAFGEVGLHSPRKLFGVGDGGLLVGPDLPAPTLHKPDDSLWRANDLRAADPDGDNPAPWFAAFKAREAAFDAAPHAIDPRTVETLAVVDVVGEIAARRANWQVLAAELADIALWPDASVAFAPLAFPVVVDDAGALSVHMAAERIWCARHWADLPSPDGFADAHALSGRCLSLPLDGRYGTDDMERIIAAVRTYPR